MGRQKITIEKIKADRIRQVTFYKRKRGLIKKAMELSLLCGVKLFLSISDKNEKLTIFSTVGRKNCDYLKDVKKEKIIEFYCDKDVNLFLGILINFLSNFFSLLLKLEGKKISVFLFLYALFARITKICFI